MGLDGKHWALVGALALGLAGPAAGDCRLALVLGMDVSSSVVAREYRLMMDGTAAAMRSEPVRAAFLDDRPVALAAFVWAGVREHALVVDWVVIADRAALEEAAARIEGFARPGGDALDTWSGLTAVGAALLAARALLDRAPDCDTQTVDLAGDGVNNAGPEPGPLRRLHFEGVTINALAVPEEMSADYHLVGDGVAPLSRWMQENVVHGPGGFVEPAAGYADFERAMSRKLLRELRPPLIGRLDATPRG